MTQTNSDLIDSVVAKLFGTEDSTLTTRGMSDFYDQTSDSIIKEFLFENSPIAEEINSLIKRINELKEKNS
jgi:hypothetical protein